MTTANKITILRILLIPIFVVEMLYYVETGNELHRLVALLTFAVAAILDGVDGYVARHYQPAERTRHGAGPARGQAAAGLRHRGVELRSRAAARPNPALAHRHHHRPRPADGHRRGDRAAGGRQDHRAPAPYRQNRHGVSDGRGDCGFCCAGISTFTVISCPSGFSARACSPASPVCFMSGTAPSNSARTRPACQRQKNEVEFIKSAKDHRGKVLFQALCAL